MENKRKYKTIFDIVCALKEWSKDLRHIEILNPPKNGNKWQIVDCGDGVIKFLSCMGDSIAVADTSGTSFKIIPEIYTSAADDVPLDGLISFIAAIKHAGNERNADGADFVVSEIYNMTKIYKPEGWTLMSNLSGYMREDQSASMYIDSCKIITTGIIPICVNKSVLSLHNSVMGLLVDVDIPIFIELHESLDPMK